MACGDAIVRNNIVLNCDGYGIGISNTAPAEGNIDNVTMVNNTVYNDDASDAECLYLSATMNATVTISNNALYCPNTEAVSCSGLYSSATVADNYVEGTVSGGAGCSEDGSEFIDGGTAATAFINPAIPPLAADFWPKSGSALTDTGNATDAPADDFNAVTRTGTDDVGAYEGGTCSYNNGWALAQTVKGSVSVCSSEVCGNGAVEGGEACDDGNLAAGDCCNTDCTAKASVGTSCNDSAGECDADAACVLLRKNVSGASSASGAKIR